MFREVIGSLLWPVLKIGLAFGPEGPEGPFQPFGLDVSVLCQD